MRIRHNIPALYSHRQLLNTYEALKKNLERLASGYRINRAADDAAGLQISEHMRGQIRGLRMANRNTLDAISLVQTAEGGLQEIHEMLQRMRELAVQAATDTLTDEDRKKIQIEVNQLVDEIDRMAEAVEFNRIKLLWGARGEAGASRAYSVSEVVTNGGGVQYQDHNNDEDYEDPGEFITGKRGLKLDVPYTAAGFESNIPTGSIIIRNAQTSWRENAISLVEPGNTYTATPQGNFLPTRPRTLSEIIDDINDIPGVNASYDEEKDTFTITHVGDIILEERPAHPSDVGLFSALNISAYNIRNPIGRNPKGDDITITTPVGSGFYAGKGEGVKSTITGVAEVVSDRMKSLDLEARGVFSAAGTTAPEFHPLVNAGFEAVPTGSIIITTLGRRYHLDINRGNPDVDTYFNVAVYEGDNRIYQYHVDITCLQDIIDWMERERDYKVYNTATSSWEYRPGPGLKVEYKDDIFIITNDGYEFKLQENPGLHGVSMPGDEALARLTAPNLGFFTAINVVVANESAYNKKEGYWEGIYSPANVLGLTIHVGANMDEVIVVNIENVSSERLKVRDTETGKPISFSTREDAEVAIEVLDKAIDEVSWRRANLGAYQNRLQHTLNYLGISEESMTAAESRIRDTDYAKEMSSFIRNQILLQSGTLMMAHANMMPQIVLTLLG